MKKLLCAASAAVLAMSCALPAAAQVATYTDHDGSGARITVPVTPLKPLPVMLRGTDSGTGLLCDIGSTPTCQLSVTASLSISNYSLETGGHLANIDTLLQTQNAALGQTTPVHGPAASGATFIGQPLPDGCLAKTALPTAVSDGQAVANLCDKYGRQVSPSVLRENKGIQETDISGTAETTVVTADASNKLELYCLILANTNTTNPATATVKDATAGTTRSKFQIPAGDTRGFCGPADSGWPQAAVNSNWTVTLAGTSPTVSVTALYLKSGS